MIKFKSVSHRLIFWVLGASASLFLLTSYYEYATAEKFLRDQIKSKAELAKLNIINRIDNLLQNVSESAGTVAAVLPLTYQDQQGIHKLLGSVVMAQEHVYGMAVALEPEWSMGNLRGFAPYYYKRKGKLEHADLSTDAYDYRSQPWYTVAVKQGHEVWSEPYNDDGGGNIAMVTYSLPIFARIESGWQLVGVTTADIALSSLAKLVNKLSIGENGFAYLVTRKGTIITHSNPELVMSNITNMTADDDTYQRLQPVLQGMLKGEAGTVQVPCRDNLSGGGCWVSYQPIKGTDWLVAVSIPMNEISSSLDQYRIKSLKNTGIGLLLLTVIIVLISRRVTIPLLALTESSRKLASGDLNTAIPDYGLADEVGTLARQFQRMQSELKDYIHKLNQATAMRERLEGELGAAHEIQMQMLPNHGSSHIERGQWQLSAKLIPAKSVGGDFYHYQSISDDEVFFAIGDVSDKGVAAALFMAKTQTLLRQLCTSTGSLEELLALINQQLCIDNDSCMFVTVICGIVNTSSGQIKLASAGHNPPLLKAGGCEGLIMDNGPALGFFEQATFISTEINLAKGQQLILTTDGVDEANDCIQEFYGESRLRQLITAAHDKDSKELLEAIIDDVIAFRGEAEQSDDLTIMIISRRLET